MKPIIKPAHIGIVMNLGWADRHVVTRPALINGAGNMLYIGVLIYQPAHCPNLRFITYLS
jgi:hypothetical protein